MSSNPDNSPALGGQSGEITGKEPQLGGDKRKGIIGEWWFVRCPTCDSRLAFCGYFRHSADDPSVRLVFACGSCLYTEWDADPQKYKHPFA